MSRADDINESDRLDPWGQMVESLGRCVERQAAPEKVQQPERPREPLQARPKKRKTARDILNPNRPDHPFTAWK